MITGPVRPQLRFLVEVELDDAYLERKRLTVDQCADDAENALSDSLAHKEYRYLRPRVTRLPKLYATAGVPWWRVLVTKLLP